jgi:hypothetical protein
LLLIILLLVWVSLLLQTSFALSHSSVHFLFTYPM